MATSEEVRRPLLTTASQITPQKHSLREICNVIDTVRKRNFARLNKQQYKKEYKSKSENRARKVLLLIYLFYFNLF